MKAGREPEEPSGVIRSHQEPCVSLTSPDGVLRDGRCSRRVAGLVLRSPTEIPAFLAACAEELAAPLDAAAAARADAANESGLPRPWLVARNLLFCELATEWVGWAGLRPFFEALLRVERFHHLEPVEPEMRGRSGAG